MVKDALYFMIPLLLLSAGAFYFGWWAVGLPLVVVTAFVAYFFRDPSRTVPPGKDSVVSPADGKIIRVEPRQEGTFVSIFLSVFDVHVNRAPIGGTILSQEHRSGRFLPAFDHRASVENEQLRLTVGGERRISFALIAGLVARRIVPWKKQGDRVRKGDKIGLIRFGSRVDILLPPSCKVTVKEGDRVRGGSSILAHWSDSLETEETES